MKAFFIWLVIALCALILEMGSPGLLFFVSFAFGALISALASLWFDSLVIQCSAFLGGTLVALMMLRYWVVLHGKKMQPHTRTNVYALRGKHGVVLVSISSEKPGTVKIGGEVWAARSVSRERIEQGEEVEVIDVRGAHVVVEKIKT